MKNFPFFLLLLPVLLPGLLWANDGVFYAQGNHLIPVKETSIELKKEVLNLTRDGEWMEGSAVRFLQPRSR